MYKKIFYVIVGEDSFPFLTIDLDDIGTSAKNSSQEHLLTVFSKNPTVIELNGITPKFGTEWDGTNFTEFINQPVLDENFDFNSDTVERIKYYSLVVNGKHSSIFGINTITSEGQMIAAALSSNPQIVGNLVS